MARYQKVLPTRRAPVELHHLLVNYLTGQGFRLVDQQQNLWQKGMGLLTGPQFIRFESHPWQLRLEAWIKFAVLPGVYVGEWGIDGLFLIVLKKLLKSRVVEIERLAGS